MSPFLAASKRGGVRTLVHFLSVNLSIIARIRELSGFCAIHRLQLVIRVNLVLFLLGDEKMRILCKRFLTTSCFSIVLLVVLQNIHGQTILWEQAPDTNATTIIDQEILIAPVFSTYAVSDVVFNEDVIVDSVTVFFTNDSTQPFFPTTARLNIFPATDGAPLFQNNPSGGDLVAVDVGSGLSGTLITANGLNRFLPKGSYWIGLSPVEDIQEFHFQSTSNIGLSSWARNPSGAFGFGMDWIPIATLMAPGAFDLAIRVTGSPAGSFEPPAVFELSRGNSISGGLAEMQESDDIRASYTPGFTLNSDEAPVWLIFGATVGGGEIDFLVESQSNTPNLTYTVEAFNWNTNEFDVVGQASESFNADSVENHPIVAADHIDSGGEVRSRVGWRQTGFTLLFPWQISVDQVGWEPS